MSGESWEQVLQRCQHDIERYQRELEELRQRPLYVRSVSNEMIQQQPAAETVGKSLAANIISPSRSRHDTKPAPIRLSTAIRSEEDDLLCNIIPTAAAVSAGKNQSAETDSKIPLKETDSVEYEQLRLISSRQVLEIRSLVEQQQILRRENTRLIRENLLWKRSGDGKGEAELFFPIAEEVQSAVEQLAKSVLSQLEAIEALLVDKQAAASTRISRLTLLKKFVGQLENPERRNNRPTANLVSSMQRFQEVVEDSLPMLVDALQSRLERRLTAEAAVDNSTAAASAKSPAVEQHDQQQQLTSQLKLAEESIARRDAEIARMHNEIDTLRSKLTSVGHERRHSASVGETVRMRELQSQLDMALRDNKMLQSTTADLRHILSSNTRAASPILQPPPQLQTGRFDQSPLQAPQEQSPHTNQQFFMAESDFKSLDMSASLPGQSSIALDAEQILAQQFADEDDLDRLAEWIEEHIRFSASLKLQLQQARETQLAAQDRLAHREREFELLQSDRKSAQKVLVEYEEQFSRILAISGAPSKAINVNTATEIPLIKHHYPMNAAKAHPLPFIEHFEHTLSAHNSAFHGQAHFKAQLQQAQQLVEQLQKRCRELESELRIAVDHSESKEAEVQELVKRLATLSSAMDSLNSQYKELANQKLAADAKISRISEGFKLLI